MARWRIVVAIAGLLYLVGSGVLIVAVWVRTGDGGTVATVVTVLLAVPTAVPLAVGLVRWAWRPAVVAAGPTAVEDAAGLLAGLVAEQWSTEARLRSLDSPDPMPVRWRPPGGRAWEGLLDHPDNTHDTGRQPVTGSSADIDRLTERFRALRRRRLVILGGPGTGKSTLAMQLVRSLLVSRQEGEPVPVLMTVAGWDPSIDPDLRDWLTARLDRDYPALRSTPLGRQAARTLTNRGLVLPVLDGLDELPPPARSAAITALNRSMGDGDQLILTSRTGEYTDAIRQAGGVLTSTAAVMPHQLTPHEAAGYLRTCLPPDTGPAWRRVLDHLESSTVASRRESALARVVATPLGLWLLRTVYVRPGAEPDRLLTYDFQTEVELRAHLLDELIPALISVTPSGRPPSRGRADPLRPRRHHDPERVRLWLGHLAAYLSDVPADDGSTGTRDFAWWHLARHTLRPRTLPILAGIVGTLVVSVVVGLHSWATSPERPATGAWLGTVAGLAFAVAAALWIWLGTPRGSRSLSRPRRFRARQLTGPVAGLLVLVVARGSLLLGFPLALGVGLGLWYRYGGGLPVAHWTREVPASVDLRLSSRIGLLIRRVVRGLLSLGLAAGAVTGLVAGLAMGFYAAARYGELGEALAVVVQVWLAVGLAVGIPAGILAGLVSWAQTATPERRADTPLSTWRADRVSNLFTIGSAGGLAALAVGWWQAGVDGPARGITDALLVAPLAAFLGAFLGRHHAWLAYLVATNRLARKGRLPRRLMPFLDDAHRLGLLRTVGPIYQFRHAALQDHLAMSMPGRPAAPARRRGLLAAGIAVVLAAVAVIVLAVTAPWTGSDDSDPPTRDPEDGSFAALTGHDHAVTSVGFSPDGSVLASAGDDTTIRLWDVDTAEPITTLTGHRRRPVSVAFAPDGETFASASGDGTVQLWATDREDPQATLTSDSTPVWAVAFSPDGSTLATGGTDQTVELWDTASGELVETLTGHHDRTWSLAFSPDGTVLATAGNTGVHLWDVDSAEPTATLTGHEGSIRSVAFGPDGSTLASAGADGTVRLWNTSTGRPKLRFAGHRGTVWSVAFSPDGDTLATGGADRRIQLWDVATNLNFERFTGHVDEVRSVAFSPDGGVLASASSDTTVRLWELD